MMLEIKHSKVDWTIVFCVFLFALYSLLAVYSATFTAESKVSLTFQKQVVWILVGLVVGGVVTFVPTSWLAAIAYPAYSFLLILLLMLEALKLGDPTGRWFVIAGIKFQPSEFMKPILVMTVARYLNNNLRSPDDIKTLASVFVIIAIPFVLVLKQPDLGTSLTFLAIYIPMLYWRGMSAFKVFMLLAPFFTFVASFNFWSFFLVILLISLVLFLSRRGVLIFWSAFSLNVSVGLIAPMVWNRLHEYQQQRILTFLGLVSDPKGMGYQIIQSKVAIGSGGAFGKGFLHGSQTQLRFLPAQHTDFIFSVIAEEWGFVGAILLILIFVLFLYRGIYIAHATKNRFAGLMTIGLVTIFAFQIFVNVGMTLGIMPVTGLPLPFISYGGSSMLTSMLMAGLIANTYVHRYSYN